MIRNKSDYNLEINRRENLTGLVKDWMERNKNNPESILFKKQYDVYKKQLQWVKQEIKEYETKRGIESTVQ